MMKVGGSLWVSVGLAMASTLAVASPQGEWIYESTPRATVTVTARINLADAALLVRCMRRKPEAVIVFSDHLGAGRKLDVRYRIDDGEATGGDWPTASSQKAVFVPDPALATFVERLAAGRELVVTVTNGEGTRHRRTIPLTGAADKVTRVMRECQEA